MKLTTTQPVEGVGSCQTIDVDEKRSSWLLANGYATKPDGNPADYDGATNTSVPADQDPTLARNAAQAESKADDAGRGRGRTPSARGQGRREA